SALACEPVKTASSASGSGPCASFAQCSQAGRSWSSAPPPPLWWSSRHGALDDHPIRNNGVLDDDDNAVADDKAQVFLVGLLHVVAVHNPYMTPDPGVFVDNGFGDRRVCTHPEGNGPLLDVFHPLARRFVIVRAHHERILDHTAGFDARAE